jgi:transcription initiation factor TFIIIB Brf1 subunit/transcription initiation factor TFIIB
MLNMNINSISKFQLEELLFSFGDVVTNIEDSNNCPNCGQNDFIEERKIGRIICRCGQVIGDLYDLRPEQTISNDREERTNNNIIYNELLPQSTMMTNSNLKGTMLKIQIWNSMPSKERSNNMMFKKIKKVCETYKICKKIEEEAKIMFKKVSDSIHKEGKNKGKMIITRGNNRKGIVASCLAEACENNQETRTAKEMACYFNIEEKDVNEGKKNLKNILGNVSKKSNNIAKPSHFTLRKCDELHIKRKEAEIALKITLNLEKLNIASNHTTETIAAACIYLMTVIQKLPHVSRKDVSNVFGNLSDATLIKTYKEIKDYGVILMDNAKINKICSFADDYISKKYVSKEIWEMMVKFGVGEGVFTVI